jgi:two-component sensor histidine kinase
MANHSEEDSFFRSWASVTVVAIFVSVVGLLFDRLLLREGVPRYDLMAISNSLTGIVAGAFFWQAKRLDLDRRQFIRERLHTISEMNHHIRNALQVISLYSGKQSDETTVTAIGQAVNRIEWALSEVLPAELLSESLSTNVPVQFDSRIAKH